MRRSILTIDRRIASVVKTASLSTKAKGTSTTMFISDSMIQNDRIKAYYNHFKSRRSLSSSSSSPSSDVEAESYNSLSSLSSQRDDTDASTTTSFIPPNSPLYDPRTNEPAGLKLIISGLQRMEQQITNIENDIDGIKNIIKKIRNTNGRTENRLDTIERYADTMQQDLYYTMDMIRLLSVSATSAPSTLPTFPVLPPPPPSPPPQLSPSQANTPTGNSMQENEVSGAQNNYINGSNNASTTATPPPTATIQDVNPYRTPLHDSTTMFATINAAITQQQHPNVSPVPQKEIQYYHPHHPNHEYVPRTLKSTSPSYKDRKNKQEIAERNARAIREAYHNKMQQQENDKKGQ